MRYTLESALWGLQASPVRSLAIFIALASAACCVLLSAAIIAGFDETLLRLNFGLAANAVTVRANPITNERSGPPNSDDLAAVLAAMPDANAHAGWVEGTAALRAGRDTISTPVYGASGDYQRELATDLVSGRWPSATEMDGDARLCLLGAQIADRIGKAAQPGQTLHLNGLSCQVAAIMAFPSIRPARRFADAIVMPITVARRYFAEASAQPRDLGWFTLYFADGDRSRAARQRIDQLLRKLRGVPQSRLSPFLYDDPDAPVQDEEEQRTMMARLLGTITAIILLLSILAYATMMFSAARARAREFAIRMAMGALPGAVGRQIIVENLLLSLAGSIAGLGSGVALAWIAAAHWGWPVAISAQLALFTAVGSVVTGGLIGWYGGRVAERTAPAQAAR